MPLAASLFDMISNATYGALAAVALWGLFCIVIEILVEVSLFVVLEHGLVQENAPLYTASGSHGAEIWF